MATDRTTTLTAEKIEEAKEVFANFDRDADGRITAGELGSIMRQLGANPTQAELQELIGEVDSGRDGTIDMTEFLKLFEKKMQEPDTEADLIEAFRKFDADENGFISAEELRQTMLSLGETLTPEEADEMVREQDIDGDGFISYHEFVRIMMTR